MIPSLRDQKPTSYNTRYWRNRNKREVIANAMALSKKSHASGIRKNGSTNVPSGATEEPITAYATAQDKLAATEKIATRIIN